MRIKEEEEEEKRLGLSCGVSSSSTAAAIDRENKQLWQLAAADGTAAEDKTKDRQTADTLIFLSLRLYASPADTSSRSIMYRLDPTVLLFL